MGAAYSAQKGERQMKELTMDNITMGTVLKTAEGQWINNNPYSYGVSAEGRYNINYSDILTFLIQKAGTICKHYASDLFITWKSVMKELDHSEIEKNKFLFGFREMGVDHNTWVLNRYNNYGSDEREIKEMYLVTLETETLVENGRILGKYITMKLGIPVFNEEEEEEE